MSGILAGNRRVRGLVVVALAGGLTFVGVGMSQAAVPGPISPVGSARPSLPPLPAPALPALPGGPTLPGPPGTPTLPGLPTLPGSTPGSGSTNAGSGSSRPAPSTPAPSTRSSSGAGTTSGARSTAPSSPGSVRAQTPVASLCLIPTGASSPAFDLSLTALGQDLSSPLVQHIPQVFAPCPAGAVPASDQLASADATVTGLLGACIRVTRQVAPVQTTIVVLNHDLIRELTAAGVPLRQLLVPCPAGIGSGTTTNASSAVPQGASLAGESLGDAAATGRLAFTGIDLVPAGVLAATLLWLGTVLTRASRLVAVRSGSREG